MKSITGVSNVLLAAALCVFAQSSIAAPQKTYSLVIDASTGYTTPEATPANPSPQPVLNTPVAVTVTVKNESPPSTANSNISSFTFSLAGLAIADPSQITLTSCPFGSPCFVDTKASFSATGNTISVTNISPPLQGQGTYTVGFNVTSCGDGSVTNVVVYSGSQLNGQTFGFKSAASVLAKSINCGDLACGTPFTVPGSTPTVTGRRGPYDKDGAACSVPTDTFEYYVTNTVGIVGGNLHFRWPVNTEPNADQAAAFTYTIAAASGNPQVAWLTVNGSPVFIPAYGCSGGLPAPYTTLASDVTVSSTKIKVTSTPAGLPTGFAIVIGAERMQVTNVSNNNWTVTRHTGGTNAAKHFTADPVMSTPLPILPAGTPSPYTAGYQAQMCLVGSDTSAPSTTFIDIGDGWGNP